MTSDPQTPEPTRNPPGIVFDLLLLSGGAYATARTAGRLIKRTGQAGVAASFSSTALTVFFLALGVAAVTLAVPALLSNLRKVPRNERGRPLSMVKRDEGE